MNLKEMEKEELQELSMVEIAFAIMKEERKPFEYYDLVKRVAEIKGLSEEQVNDRIAYLYTDLNIDGRFLTLGDNQWGLKVWYPLEQAEEEITAPVKPRKKVKEEEVEDLAEDFDDYEDEYEDLEDELDEISSEEDADDDDFDDDDDVDGFDDDDDSEEDDKEEDLDDDEEDEI